MGEAVHQGEGTELEAALQFAAEGALWKITAPVSMVALPIGGAGPSGRRAPLGGGKSESRAE